MLQMGKLVNVAIMILAIRRVCDGCFVVAGYKSLT